MKEGDLRRFAVASGIVLGVVSSGSLEAQSFDVVEASIAEIHAAMRAGDLTATVRAAKPFLKSQG